MAALVRESEREKEEESERGGGECVNQKLCGEGLYSMPAQQNVKYVFKNI